MMRLIRRWQSLSLWPTQRTWPRSVSKNFSKGTQSRAFTTWCRAIPSQIYQLLCQWRMRRNRTYWSKRSRLAENASTRLARILLSGPQPLKFACSTIAKWLKSGSRETWTRNQRSLWTHGSGKSSAKRSRLKSRITWWRWWRKISGSWALATHTSEIWRLQRRARNAISKNTSIKSENKL